MPRYLLHHRHEPHDCGVVFAAFKGHDSPLRHRRTLASCLSGGHSIWWTVEAAGAEDALARVPFYVAGSTVVTHVSDVADPMTTALSQKETLMSRRKHARASAALLATAVACLAAAPAGAVVEGVEGAALGGAVVRLAGRLRRDARRARPGTDRRALRKAMSPAALHYVGVGPVGRTPNAYRDAPQLAQAQRGQLPRRRRDRRARRAGDGRPAREARGVDAPEALILGTGRRFAPGTGHTEAATLDSTLRAAPFIADPTPTWAPTKGGATVRMSGTRRVGRRLTCSVSDYAPEAGVKVSLSWVIVGAGSAHFGAPKVVGHGRTYKVAKAARGRRIACVASAENDGGYIQIGLVSRTVKR